MPGIFAFCRCVGEAVLAKGTRGLAGLVPFGDHLYDIAVPLGLIDAFAWPLFPEVNCWTILMCPSGTKARPESAGHRMDLEGRTTCALQAADATSANQ